MKNSIEKSAKRFYAILWRVATFLLSPLRRSLLWMGQTIPTNQTDLPETTLKLIASNLLVCSDHTIKQVLVYMSPTEKEKIEFYLREALAEKDTHNNVQI